MAEKVNIVLVRHGESEANVDPRHYLSGDDKVGLTRTGCQQSLAAGEFLAEFYKARMAEQADFEPAIFVSPYQRALQTLRGLCDGGLVEFFGEEFPKIKQDDRLIEKFFGAESEMGMGDPSDYSLGLINDLMRLQIRTDRANPFVSRKLLGESTNDVSLRVKSFIEGTLARDVAQGLTDFLIVAHGAVIRSFVNEFFHIPSNSPNRIEAPKNCDVIVIEGVPKNWSVSKVYDGLKMGPTSLDLLEGIEFITLETLPSLPFPRSQGPQARR